MASARAGPGSGLIGRQALAVLGAEAAGRRDGDDRRPLRILDDGQAADGAPVEGADLLPGHAEAASSGRAIGPPLACS